MSGNTAVKDSLILLYGSDIKALEAEFANTSEHTFSRKFEKEMQPLLKKPERKYIRTFGKMMQKSVVAAILVMTVFVSTFTTMAIVRTQIFRQEIRKEKTHWDISLQREKRTDETDFEPIVPYIPAGFQVIEKNIDQNFEMVTAEYENQKGERIQYAQYTSNINIGIDAEGNDIHEEKINGCDAIVHHNKKDYSIILNNGIYTFSVDGNCDYSILMNMAYWLTKR